MFVVHFVELCFQQNPNHASIRPSHFVMSVSQKHLEGFISLGTNIHMNSQMKSQGNIRQYVIMRIEVSKVEIKLEYIASSVNISASVTLDGFSLAELMS